MRQMDKAKTPARSAPAITAPAITAPAITALVALLALGGCNDSARRPAAEAAAGPLAPASQPDYAPPPRISSVTGKAGGSAIIAGSAAPDSRVRAETADQATYGATAGHDGRFEIELPMVGRSRLVALSVEGPSRSTRATGWLFVPPDAPERAVLLKAGAAAGPLAGAGLIAAVDYDPGGGVAASGRTAPNASVALAVDGGAGQEAQADPAGVWSVRITTALSAGPHVLHVRSGGARADRTVVLGGRSVSGVFQAIREHDAWRVDWTPPGGGAQSTLVLLANPQGSAPS